MRERVIEILRQHKGREAAITSIDIGRLLGIGDREVRALIGDLVAQGHLICAASEPPMGYFIPDNPGEVDRYAQTLKARGMKILKRLSTISKSAARQFLEEQMEIFK